MCIECRPTEGHIVEGRYYGAGALARLERALGVAHPPARPRECGSDLRAPAGIAQRLRQRFRLAEVDEGPPECA